MQDFLSAQNPRLHNLCNLFSSNRNELSQPNSSFDPNLRIISYMVIMLNNNHEWNNYVIVFFNKKYILILSLVKLT